MNKQSVLQILLTYRIPNPIARFEKKGKHCDGGASAVGAYSHERYKARLRLKMLTGFPVVRRAGGDCSQCSGGHRGHVRCYVSNAVLVCEHSDACRRGCSKHSNGKCLRADGDGRQLSRCGFCAASGLRYSVIRIQVSVLLAALLHPCAATILFLILRRTGRALTLFEDYQFVV